MSDTPTAIPRANPRTLGQLLRAERERAGKSMGELARCLDISERALSALEHSRCPMLRPSIFRKAALYLGSSEATLKEMIELNAAPDDALPPLPPHEAISATGNFFPGGLDEDALLARVEALEGWAGVFVQRFRAQRGELAAANERIANLLTVGDQLRSEIAAWRRDLGDRQQDLARVTKQRDLVESALRAAVDQRMELRAENARAGVTNAPLAAEIEGLTAQVTFLQYACERAVQRRDTAERDLARVTKQRDGAELIGRNALAAGRQLRKELDAMRAGSKLTMGDLEAEIAYRVAITKQRDAAVALLDAAIAERDRKGEWWEHDPVAIDLSKQSASDRDRLRSELDATAAQRDALKGELEILRGVEPLPFRDLATLEGQGRIIRATRAERDQLKADLAAMTAARDQARADADMVNEQRDDALASCDRLRAELIKVAAARDSARSEGDQYRRDFQATSDRAAELAARVSAVEAERDRLRAALAELRAPEDWEKGVLAAIDRQLTAVPADDKRGER